MEQKAVLSCEHVSFCYPRQTDNAIEDISFSIGEAEFVVLCGQSGCGKTTLLRHFKKNQIPFGTGSGKLYYRGSDLETMDDRESAARIGFVGQNPDTQLVTDKVWHELAFGLENLGVPGEQIRRRTAEIAQYFGMESWFRRPVSELSGGQKQLLNLASVVIMQPDVLLLDEPTAQLDPIGTGRFLDTLRRLNRDLGTAVLLSEQRLEEVVPMADRVLIMHQGHLVADAVPGQCAAKLEAYERDHNEALPIASAMPVAVRVWKACHYRDEANSPVSIRQGKSWLADHVRKTGQPGEPIKSAVSDRHPCHTAKRAVSETALFVDRLCFGYQKDQRVLEDFTMRVPKGMLYAVVGGNGSGKSTALKAIMGICKPRRGNVKAAGKIRFLAQNPKSLFTELTAAEELMAMLLPENGGAGLKEADRTQRVGEMLSYLELTAQREQNPMDLSGGQQQRLALGKLLLTEPDILLLDEPTKGLDGAFKEKLAEFLKDLCSKGKTVVLVSHDMEFCARYADQCGLLFDGQLISEGETRAFFRENVFYTTAAQRMSRGVCGDCLLAEDIVRALQEAGCAG
ncbi:ABC transporter ATP-binding protein [Roseburia sp. AM59-24XD]|jgi:energy-coupling factor transporter ATP-binding protein EcfA2|uniref:ABC transporter ATP-binding protein n=1 Tax=Roseburia sp. AM59-24XD TaxID=2293138 RepID=UPI000E54ECA4|nr:ATP-binding cassette domain-containing protein [Roseburia sp. AM59-24XD]RHP86296.1 ATP-binding cassette domain-containing protein [Roseburia sp. AM59-24XD]